MTELPHRKQRILTAGFTLIEVVLALGIMGVMLSIGWGALRNVAESRRLLNERQDVELIGHAIVTRLVRELQLATRSLPLIPPSSSPNTRYGPEDSFFAESSANGDEWTLSFLALEGGQYLPDGGQHTGTVQIAYRLLPTPEEEGRAPGTLSLIRSEMPYVRPFSKAYEQEMVFPVTHDISSAQFEFYNENKAQWINSWKPGDVSGIPSLIRFSITVRSPLGRISRSYTSEVALPQP